MAADMHPADDLTITPQDRDIAIRTMIGEEGSPGGQAGVAATMLNRAQSGAYGGSSLSAVAKAPGQFEPWATRAGALNAIQTSSPQYQQAAGIFDGVVSGAIPDPTGGATHFYAPAAQKALGRPTPTWAKGDGVNLGSSLFYAPNGPSSYKPPSGQPVDLANDPTIKKYMQPAEAAPDLANDPTIQKYMQPAAPSAAPAAPAPPSNASPVGAFAGGVVNGAPVAGSALLSATQKAAALWSHFQYGIPYDEALKFAQNRSAEDAAAYPKTALAGNIVGGVAGTLPLMAAAPAAMGIDAAAPVFSNMLTGAAGGGAINAADAFVRSGGDPRAAANGAATGALFGLGAPAVGKAIGAGVNSLSNLLSGASSGTAWMAAKLQKLGTTPEDVRTQMAGIGPGATPADVSDALATHAGALAASGDAPTEILKNAFAARAAAKDNRVGQALDTALGPAPDMTAAQAAIEAKAHLAAGPFYKAAEANPTPMDVSPVMADIDARLPNAVGGTAQNLNMVKGWLTDPTTGLPKTDPAALLEVRQELDGHIAQGFKSTDSTATKNAIGALKDARSGIDAVLKTDPNIAAGDAAYAQQMKVRTALQNGSDLLDNNVSPQDFSRSIAAMSPDELDALRVGARGAIAQKMGGVNGDYSAARSLFAKSSNNRAKLDALFPNAGDVFDAVHGEMAMRGTEQSVIGNSKTAERLAAAKEWSPDQGGGALPAIAAAAATQGVLPAAAEGAMLAGRGVKNAFTSARRGRLMESAARGLSSSGPAADDFLDQVSKVYGGLPMANAFTRVGQFGLRLAGGAAAQQVQNFPANNLFLGPPPNQ